MINFCIVLGQALGVNTPANGSVNGTQLAKPFNYDNYFYLNDTTNRVGVGTATPMTPLHVEGTGRFTNVTVTGDLTVEGTTTTLDTVVTEVDKLEVGANNNTVGVAITQSGSGDAAYFMGGDVGIGTNNPQGKLHISDTNHPLVIDDNSSNVDQGIVFTSGGSSTYKAAIRLTPGGADKGLRFHTGGYANSVERLRIHSNGKFSFGTATAGTAKYTFNSAGTNEVARFESTDTGAYLAIKDSSSTSINFVEGGGDVLSFGVNNVERLRITTSGVGIGTDDPQSQFEVYGTSPIIRSKHSTSQKYTQINHDGTDGYLDWSSGGLIFRGASNTERLRIKNTGDITFTGPSNSSVTIQYANNYAKLDLRGNGIVNARHYILGYGAGHASADDFHMVNGTPGGNLAFRTGSSTTQRLRIDSSGRVLIDDAGTAGPMETFGSAVLQVATTAGGTLVLGRNDSSVSTDNGIGSIYFDVNDSTGNAWNETARITVNADGDHANNDYPSRMEFYTTGDGEATPTERLRIASNGYVGINLDANTSSNATFTPWTNLHVVGSNVADGVNARNNATPTGQLHVSSSVWNKSRGNYFIRK